MVDLHRRGGPKLQAPLRVTVGVVRIRTIKYIPLRQSAGVVSLKTDWSNVKACTAAPSNMNGQPRSEHRLLTPSGSCSGVVIIISARWTFVVAIVLSSWSHLGPIIEPFQTHDCALVQPLCASGLPHFSLLWSCM